MDSGRRMIRVCAETDSGGGPLTIMSLVLIELSSRSMDKWSLVGNWFGMSRVFSSADSKPWNNSAFYQLLCNHRHRRRRRRHCHRHHHLYHHPSPPPPLIYSLIHSLILSIIPIVVSSSSIHVNTLRHITVFTIKQPYKDLVNSVSILRDISRNDAGVTRTPIASPD